MVKTRFLLFMPLSLVLLGILLAGTRLSSASKFDAYMPPDLREDQLASRFSEGSRAIQLRQNLIESLERLLVEQHRFREVHGRFTRNLRRLDWEVSREIQRDYEFTVVEASQARLLITATSESIGSQPVEVVSIDQDSRVHASFPIPAPRADYLRERAKRELMNPEAWPAVSLASRHGPWQGYFEIRPGESGERIAFGYKAPVLGDRLGSMDLLPESANEDGAQAIAENWGFEKALESIPGVPGKADADLRRIPSSIEKTAEKTAIAPVEPLIVEPLQ